MDNKTIIKLLLIILTIIVIGGVMIYSKITNIDNNISRYCLQELT